MYDGVIKTITLTLLFASVQLTLFLKFRIIFGKNSVYLRDCFFVRPSICMSVRTHFVRNIWLYHLHQAEL